MVKVLLGVEPVPKKQATKDLHIDVDLRGPNEVVVVVDLSLGGDGVVGVS